MPRTTDPSAARRTSRPDGSLTRTIAAAAALTATVAGGLATLWLWGAIGAAIAGAPVPARFGDGPLTLIRLAFHLDDPAQAWGDAGDELPSPAVLWILLLALFAIWTLAAAVVARAARRRGWVGGRGEWARWARSEDLRELRVDPGAHRNRLALGTHHGRLLAADEESSVLVIAPPRSGKTAGLVKPALLEWEGPVITTSVKGDLLDTAERRAQLGEVAVFDPTGSTDSSLAVGWSPITASTTWQGARETAALMVQTGNGPRSGDAQHWEDMSRRFLAPLLFAAAHSRGTMRDVLHWVATFDDAGPTAGLQFADDQLAANRALEVLQGMWEMDGKTMWSLQQTAANALDPYEDPRTLEAEATATITPDWLLAGDNTLYVVAPARDQQRLRGLFLALLNSMVAAAAARSLQLGGPLDRHLLLALDECANVAPIPDLDVWASTGGGMGIQLLTVFQSRAQAIDRWGPHKADAIMAAHRAQMYGTGLSDQASIAYLRDVLGDDEIQQISHTTGSGRQTTQRSTTWRPLVDGPTARQAPVGSGLLVYGTLPPARIDLRMWFTDRRLRSLATPASTTAV